MAGTGAFVLTDDRARVFPPGGRFAPGAGRRAPHAGTALAVRARSVHGVRVQAAELGQQAEPIRRQSRDAVGDQAQHVVRVVRAQRHLGRVIERVRVAASLIPTHFGCGGGRHGLDLHERMGA